MFEKISVFFLSQIAGRAFHKDVKLENGMSLRIIHQEDNPADVKRYRSTRPTDWNSPDIFLQVWLRG